LGIGGSDANVILCGDGERIRELWLEKRGEAEPIDLSGHLPAMLGCWTEAFNRMWYERVTGNAVSRIGEGVQCGRYDWRRCTLDGFVAEAGAVWEAKHSNGFATLDELITRYMPQLQHNMAVAGAERAILSVILGNHKHEVIEVASDWLYQLELIEAAAEFWDCVTSGREPTAAPVPVPPKPIGVREVCLDGNNAWAAAAADWLDNRVAAKIHASATKTLKELVEDDVARAFGHGVEAKRSRAGAITVRELRP
jgi:predicted phage-related endonuclease